VRSGTSLDINFIGWRTDVLVEEFADWEESAGSTESAMFTNNQR
jgi:hypothetical protein